MVRSLIVFGADVNMTDRNGISPRHMAATQATKHRFLLTDYFCYL